MEAPSVAGEWVSKAEAALTLQVSPRTVDRLIGKGKLSARKRLDGTIEVLVSGDPRGERLFTSTEVADLLEKAVTRFAEENARLKARLAELEQSRSEPVRQPAVRDTTPTLLVGSGDPESLKYGR